VNLHTLACLNPDSAFRIAYAIFTLDANFLRKAWNKTVDLPTTLLFLQFVAFELAFVLEQDPDPDLHGK
jgi:hypothetical protein